MIQTVICFSEKQRLETKQFSGVVEADATKIGSNKKSGAGRSGYNKAFVQILHEDGGDVLFELFANADNAYHSFGAHVVCNSSWILVLGVPSACLNSKHGFVGLSWGIPDILRMPNASA